MSPATNVPIPAPDVDVDLIETSGEPASWQGRKAVKLRPSSREIKMLRQSCNDCAAAVGGKKFLPPAWQESCTHDPYVTIAEVPRTEPVYEDELDGDGNPTGSKLVKGTRTVIEYVPKPNWVSITHAGGVNKGRGVERALRRGYIYPQMLKSPIWPTGIKRRCQFRECFSEALKRYANGWFCRPEEAALVRISDTSESYQVDFDSRSLQFQQDQIADNMAKVGAGR